GQPTKELAGGSVSFSPISAEPLGSSIGKIEGDGSFRLSCRRENDGAVAGKHQVTITPPEPEDQDDDRPACPAQGRQRPGDRRQGGDRRAEEQRDHVEGAEGRGRPLAPRRPGLRQRSGADRPARFWIKSTRYDADPETPDLRMKKGTTAAEDA